MAERPPVPDADAFFTEAQDVVERYARSVSALNAEPRVPGRDISPERLNEVFREVHSLKGLSSLFGADRLAELGHVAEDLLEGLRMGRLAFSDDVEEILVELIDGFQGLLAERGKVSAAKAEAADALERKLRDLLERPRAGRDESAEIGDPALRQSLTSYEAHRLLENSKAGLELFLARKSFDLALFHDELSGLSSVLSELGELIATLPVPELSKGDSISCDLIFATAKARWEVETLLAGRGVELRPLGMPEGPARTAQTPEAGVPLQTVRVDIRRLDQLMETAGQLSVSRQSLSELAAELRSHRLPAELLSRLLLEVRRLERRSEELQESILETRLVSLSQLFDRAARVVRAVARESGKSVELISSGGDVRLDKLIVEALSDTLMHLLHNAVDHGIETSEARPALGKPAHGVVHLSAEQHGSQVTISVADDGRGVDLYKIARVAVERGLLAEADVAGLGPRELLGLVFVPGFSTVGGANLLSGRGVGLDVVKTDVARLSGFIDIDSEAGIGTTVRMTLPVTLALLQGLIVEVCQHRFAIPVNAVWEVLPIGSIGSKGKRREATVPVVRLAELFSLKANGATEQGARFVVVVGPGERKLGLVVDSLQGHQALIIKPLSAVLGPVKGIAGLSLLSSGAPLLVLDVGAIVDEAKGLSAAGLRASPTPVPTRGG
jgi:two-component system, chemotaxis family, sensor kinase CheA